MAGGFTTAEIRERGVRLGFGVTSLSGESAVLAHVDFPSSVRVGKYGVDVAAFEGIALPVLRDALDHKRIVVIDEIGKIELASPRFCDLVLEVLDFFLDCDCDGDGEATSVCGSAEEAG